MRRIIKQIQNSASGQVARKIAQKVDEYSSWNAKVEQEKAKYEVVKKDTEDAVKERDSAIDELGKLHDLIVKNTEALAKEEAAYKADLNVLMMEIVNLSKDRDILSAAVADEKESLEGRIDDKRKELEGLLKQVEETSVMVSRLTKQKDVLDKQISLAEVLESNLQKEVEEKTKKVQYLEDQEFVMNERHKFLMEWEAKLKVKDDDLSILEKRLEKFYKEDFGLKFKV